MDGSDDYEFDDFVLDAQTLAILDQSEQKYLKETSSVLVPPPSSDDIVNKRLKTASGWVPGIGATRKVDDELPEISLQGDGSYGVNRDRYLKDVGEASHIQALPTNAFKRSNGISNQKEHSARVPSYGSHVSNATRPVYTTNNRQYQNPYDLNHERNTRAVKDHTSENSSALAQLAVLQQKLDQLREENLAMKSALQEAVDVKLAKEGEVSILRKSIEKNGQNHAAQIQQLKSEKDKADAKQAQMQKEMKDEIERLRTQFLFRQQELESTVRKPPASVRAKRLGRDFPSTPVPLPASISGWSRGTQKPNEATPIRVTHPANHHKASPTKQVRRSPEKPISGMLPGFENAFETSTPRRSPSTKKASKPRDERKIAAPIFGTEINNDLPLPSNLSQGPSQFRVSPPTHMEPQEAFTLRGPLMRPLQFGSSQADENDMDVAPVESDEDNVPDEIDTIESSNWKAELCRIMLTHSYGPTGEISFQQLLSSPLLRNSTHEYGTILEVISNPVKSDDYEQAIESVSISLLSLLVTIADAQPGITLTLSIIFNLLAKLAISLPGFRAKLLSCHIPHHENQASSILGIISSAILKHLQPTLLQQNDDLALEILSLLDSLCFRIDGDSVDRLVPFARNTEVLLLLMHPTRSSWFLERSSRILLFLSTYHEIYKVLLNLPERANNSVEVPVKDSLLERLCAHLIDSNIPPSSHSKTHLLSYFAQLSISNPQAHATLGASYALIPSLVIFISQLTSPLWEDDGTLVCSNETTSMMIKSLNHAIFLLYQLIFGIEPNLNLRYILQHAPHRPFNSISHIFVVTFGRLSYSEPPMWIETTKRQELEYLAETSREILEAVVDGPEGDSVWAAFQSEPDEDHMIDEEEMEAQLMG